MISSISGQVKSGIRGAFRLSLMRMGLDLRGMMLITANLEECDALDGKDLFSDHSTIDLTLQWIRIGFSDQLDTLYSNTKEHHEDPLSHTVFTDLPGGFEPHIRVRALAVRLCEIPCYLKVVIPKVRNCQEEQGEAAAVDAER